MSWEGYDLQVLEWTQEGGKFAGSKVDEEALRASDQVWVVDRGREEKGRYTPGLVTINLGAKL